MLGGCPPDLWSGHVRWVASLFLPCLEVGWGIGEALARMMAQTGVPVDTELCTVVRDYGFPVWLGNPVMALVYAVWLGGMARVVGCTADMAGILFGWAAGQVVSCGGCEILW